MMTMGFHRLPRPLLMLFFILTSSLSSAESADTEPVTYHSTVSEVRLTFFTTDQHNRSVDQLKKGDFAVVDNGLVIREFRSFTRSDVTQLDVLLLVDCSESVLPQFRQEIIDVLRLISQTQSISQDHVSVVSFGGMEPKIICARDCYASPAVKQLAAATGNGQTPLFDAVRFAADFMAEHRDPAARPVLILFSDGDDTISRSSGSDAIVAVLASETQIYAIDLGNSATSSGTGILQNMAAATGGRYFAIHEGAVTALSAALEDLHAGYIVTYRLPSRETGFHQVRILPTHDLNLQFRCRRGYHYTGTVR
jgi:VWFA-related protein